MTDLEINIALAKAMGWVEATAAEWFYFGFVGFRVIQNKVECSYGDFERNYDFDYRDPVIFVAICKHWEVSAFFRRNFCYCYPDLKDYREDSIEKAVALCVIDAAKRCIK